MHIHNMILCIHIKPKLTLIVGCQSLMLLSMPDVAKKQLL